MAIASITHKGLSEFWISGRPGKLRANLVPRLVQRLAALDAMISLDEFKATFPAYRLHPLKGQQAGRYSVVVNKNWRLTFEWDGEDVQILDLEDYH